MSTLLFSPDAATVRDALAYAAASDPITDRRGELVRDTPWRKTYRHDLADGTRLFRKVRTRRGRDGAYEWRMLAELATLDLTVPAPVFLAQSGGASAIGMMAVDGDPIDQLLVAASGQGTYEHLLVEVAAIVRRLHERRLFYRDLYWNHLFATGLDTGSIALIDVERVFRPVLRRRRWVVKDIAGLVSSWPSQCPAPDGFWDRFMREYDAGLMARDPRILRDVFAKAARIRAHVPRYG